VNRAWLTDLIATSVIAAIGAVLVLAAGGPAWAVVATFWIVYILHVVPDSRHKPR
jgi:cell division protein FtsW (lipid II flippase)